MDLGRRFEGMRHAQQVHVGTRLRDELDSTGSPDSEKPAGTEIAGHPVAEIRHRARIQSR